MQRFRTPGVPIWVTLFAAVMAVGGVVVAIVVTIDPSLVFFTEADDALARRWAGRNLGISLVTGAAVILRSRELYVWSLVAGIAREVGDGFGAATDSESVVPALIFIAIGAAAIGAIARQPNSSENQRSANGSSLKASTSTNPSLR